MTTERLTDLLSAARTARLAVLGDFFVDQYLIIDPALAEVSIETGLEAHQVVEVRCQPGAAGTITNNLAALGVGTLHAVGFRGDDGLGYELERGLLATGVDTAHLLTIPGRVTPTYTKPLVCEPGAEPRELNRLDIKNHTDTPPDVAAAVLAELRGLVDEIDALIVLDQVSEPGRGVVTAGVREALAGLASEHPQLPILADSRAHLACFREVMLKPNVHEAAAALAGDGLAVDDLPVHELARLLAQRQGRPCFITLGEDGAMVATDRDVCHVPGVPVPPPIDIVGAGDSFMAAVATTLAVGGTLEEAAQLGCLVASLTVQQIGTTGTASPEQVVARLPDSPYA